MATTRDSKGKFTKSCRIKKSKIVVKKWWKNNRDTAIGLVCVFVAFAICIITCVWLFEYKTYDVCHADEDYRINSTKEIASNGNEWIKYTFETYINDCAYKTQERTRYTIPESINVIYDSIAVTVKDLIGWITSHPVI